MPNMSSQAVQLLKWLLISHNSLVFLCRALISKVSRDFKKLITVCTQSTNVIFFLSSSFLTFWTNYLRFAKEHLRSCVTGKQFCRLSCLQHCIWRKKENKHHQKQIPEHCSTGLGLELICWIETSVFNSATELLPDVCSPPLCSHRPLG